ncbi:hypothetical protein CDD83_11034 [Cordyceps sp. RAO-2017]|nr:hypothetical protein CDD83_11034 [Cordyceps sp. RAO-2017]
MAPRTRHGPRRDSSPAEPVPEDRTLRSVSLVRAAQGTRQDNASDSEENNQEDEGDSVQGGEDGDEAGSEEMDNEERWQVMQQLLPDLSGAAGGLMTLLTDADYGNKLFRTVLKAKWASFTSIREHYQPPGTDSLFIDWLPLQARDAAAETGASVTRVLAQANSLTALNEMQRILAGLPSGKLALLEALDTAFPSLFTPRGHVRSFPDMVLGIRTCYLIELLASHEDRASVPHNTVARVFCEPNGRTNSERLCRYGPFRSLNCQADGESGPPCEQRIATILGHVTEDRRSLDVTRLRETFPLEELLKSLKQWMTSEFVEIDKTGREASQGEASNDHDDGFSGESPPIVRHSSLENK